MASGHTAHMKPVVIWLCHLDAQEVVVRISLAGKHFPAAGKLILIYIVLYSLCHGYCFTDAKKLRKRSQVQGCFACGGVAFFILLDIVDEPMNGSSYAQCATPRYLKTVQFSSVNLEPLAQTWLSSPVA